METIDFSENELTIRNMETKIVLLPKEFALLSVLYRNKGMALSREQLLQLVWGLSDSTDRTVDDHIYRLRKKLKGLEFLSIETIRGIGYRLVINSKEKNHNPLFQDDEFTEALNTLFSKYIKYGQGKGISSLISHYDNNDIVVDVDKILYSKFISGNFHDLVDQNISFFERAFFLLFIFSKVQFNPKQTLLFYEKALDCGGLPKHAHEEIQNFGLISIYIEANQYDRAHKLIKKTKQLINPEKDVELFFFLSNLEIKLHIYSGDINEAKIIIDTIQNDLMQSSFQREKSQFLILKGFYSFLSLHKKEGIAFIEKGLNLIQETAFVSAYLSAVHGIILFASQRKIGAEFEVFFKKWDSFSREYDLPTLYRKTHELLTVHLI